MRGSRFFVWLAAAPVALAIAWAFALGPAPARRWADFAESGDPSHLAGGGPTLDAYIAQRLAVAAPPHADALAAWLRQGGPARAALLRQLKGRQALERGHAALPDSGGQVLPDEAAEAVAPDDAER